MKSLKKCTGLITSAVLAGSMLASCGNTRYGLVVDNEEIKAGVFIFYTITSYYDATQIVAENGTDVTNVKNVENAVIDGISSTEWIQNKATEYCEDFVAVNKKFDEIGAQLTVEEIDEIEATKAYFIETNADLLQNNGVGEESLQQVIEYDYKWKYVFDHYYGFESENGMSEDELKDYYEENNARVKYLEISLKDTEGNLLKGTEKSEVIKMANDYAKRINEKSSVMNKLYEMNEVIDDYNEYVEEKKAEAAAAKGSTTAVTTTTTAVTQSGNITTTTTTYPYKNEVIVNRVTETTPAVTEKAEQNPAGEAQTTTTAPANTMNYFPSKKTNEHIFTNAKMGVAEVIEEAEYVYVILKADIRERMTAEDLWNESKIESLQLENYEDDFADFLDTITNQYEVKKNKSSYKRYSPFKLDLEVKN